MCASEWFSVNKQQFSFNKLVHLNLCLLSNIQFTQNHAFSLSHTRFFFSTPAVYFYNLRQGIFLLQKRKKNKQRKRRWITETSSKTKQSIHFSFPHFATRKSFTQINHTHNEDQYLCRLAAITHKCKREKGTHCRGRGPLLHSVEELDDNDMKNH